MPTEKESTRFTLVQALQLVGVSDEAYDNVFKYSNLTDNAVENFDVARSLYANMKTSVYVLARVMKIWNNEYDTANVKPLLASNSKVIHQISFEYTFDLSCIIEKAEKKQYKRAHE